MKAGNAGGEAAHGEQPPAARIRFGIGAKLGVCICACVLVAAAAVGYSMHRPFSESLVGDELQDLARNAEVAGQVLSAHIDALRQDVLFLADSTPAQGIVRARRPAAGIPSTALPNASGATS